MQIQATFSESSGNLRLRAGHSPRGTQLFLLFLWLLQARVAASGELRLEFLDPSSRVNELQLAGVEGMASIANIDL